MDPIEIDLDESSELLFKVHVEGTEHPARTRLVCEGNDMGFLFLGGFTDDPGVVQFVIPSMIGKIVEGDYNAKLEVLIENRCFSPIEFKLRFKKRLSVQVEAMSHTTIRKSSPEIKSAASLVEVRKPQTLKERLAQKKTSR